MKIRPNLLACLLVSSFLMVAGNAAAEMVEGTETQLTTNESRQGFPVIFNDTVVWMDDRNGNWDIYMYNISSEEEKQITTNESWQDYPAIYNDTIVWQDNRSGSWDIYMYNASSEEEVQITTNEAVQVSSAIYNDTIVWEDSRNGNWDIFMYNITSGNETQVTINESNQSNPAIYGDVIVWEDSRNGSMDIFMYNITSANEMQLTANKSNQSQPAIYEDAVVWIDEVNDSRQVYLYNITSEEGAQVTSNDSLKWAPAIYNDMVVWADNRSANSDIYMYNITSEEELQVTSNASNQSSPSIYENRIVWMDYRNNNWDIYMMTLCVKGTPICPTPVPGSTPVTPAGPTQFPPVRPICPTPEPCPIPEPSPTPKPTASMTVDKLLVSNADEDGSDDVSVNDTLTYNITAKNTGTANLRNVVVEDNLTGQNTRCALLQPGEECLLTVKYVVNSTDLGSNITNMGTADSDQTQPVNDIENVPVPMPEMVVDKRLISNADEDASGNVTVNDTLTYNITVTNTGTANLTNVTVKDDLTGQNRTCPFLQPGEECVLTVEHMVNSTDQGTKIVNIGTAYSDQTKPVNDTEEVSVNATDGPDAEFNMTVDKQLVFVDDRDQSAYLNAGDIVTYNITATNTGTANLTNVTVADNRTSQTISCALLQPGGECVLTVEYVVTNEDMGGTKLVNIGTASSDQTQTVSDTEEVPMVVPTPYMSVGTLLVSNADEDGSGDVTVNDTLQFRTTATNIGDVDITNVTVSENLTGNSTTCALLTPAEQCVLYTEYIVKSTDQGMKIVITCTADSDDTLAISETLEVQVEAQTIVDAPAEENVTAEDNAIVEDETAEGGNVTVEDETAEGDETAVEDETTEGDETTVEDETTEGDETAVEDETAEGDGTTEEEESTENTNSS